LQTDNLDEEREIRSQMWRLSEREAQPLFKVIRARQHKWRKKILKKYAFVFDDAATVVEDLVHTPLRSKTQQEQWIVEQQQRRPVLVRRLFVVIQRLLDALSFKLLLSYLHAHGRDIGQLMFDRIWLALSTVLPLLHETQLVRAFNVTVQEPPLDDPCMELALTLQSVPQEFCWALPFIRDWFAWSGRGGAPFIFDVAFDTWFPTLNPNAYLESMAVETPEAALRVLQCDSIETAPNFAVSLLSAALLHLCANLYGYEDVRGSYFEEHNAWITNILSNFGVSAANPFVRRAYQLHAVDAGAFGDYIDFVQDADIRLTPPTWALVKAELDTMRIDDQTRWDELRPWMRSWRQQRRPDAALRARQRAAEIKLKRLMRSHLLHLRHRTHPAIIGADDCGRLFERRWGLFFRHADPKHEQRMYAKRWGLDVHDAANEAVSETVNEDKQDVEKELKEATDGGGGDESENHVNDGTPIQQQQQHFIKMRDTNAFTVVRRRRACAVCGTPTELMCVACRQPCCSEKCQAEGWGTVHWSYCEDYVDEDYDDEQQQLQEAMERQQLEQQPQQ
jgi:hypothetical protein